MQCCRILCTSAEEETWSYHIISVQCTYTRAVHIRLKRKGQRYNTSFSYGKQWDEFLLYLLQHVIIGVVLGMCCSVCCCCSCYSYCFTHSTLNHEYKLPIVYIFNSVSNVEVIVMLQYFINTYAIL